MSNGFEHRNLFENLEFALGGIAGSQIEKTPTGRGEGQSGRRKVKSRSIVRCVFVLVAQYRTVALCLVRYNVTTIREGVGFSPSKRPFPWQP